LAVCRTRVVVVFFLFASFSHIYIFLLGGGFRGAVKLNLLLLFTTAQGLFHLRARAQQVRL
jgi:hypothetical protein